MSHLLASTFIKPFKPAVDFVMAKGCAMVRHSVVFTPVAKKVALWGMPAVLLLSHIIAQAVSENTWNEFCRSIAPDNVGAAKPFAEARKNVKVQRYGNDTNSVFYIERENRCDCNHSYRLTMATKHQLTAPTEGITCHAWNADRSMLALCPNNNEIHIYGNCKSGNWTKLHVLTEHDLLVCSLSWNAVTNKIVSCSHDRNAFVWTYDEKQNKWVPALVILRVDRAATTTVWSNTGDRFAVGSGSKVVPVCTYEASNDWWVSKMLKKFKSTILCLSFHPHTGQVLAAGSSDFKCRVFSTYSSDVDSSPCSGPFPTCVKFGDVYAELPCLGWVTATAWNPTGDKLAYTGQDSSVTVASFASGNPVLQVLRHKSLPYTSLVFLTDKAFVAAGYDFIPMVYTDKGSDWAYFDSLDKKPAAETTTTQASGGFAASRALFASKTTRGQESKAENDTLWTQHEGVISDMHMITPTSLSTAGMDGRIVMWDLPTLNIAMNALGL